MPDRSQITETVEFFYEEIIEPYKNLERQVASESRLTSIFKKVDYKDRINKFKDLKKKTQKINLKSIKMDPEDEVSLEVKEKLEKCISAFGNAIDTQVSFHTMLYNKSEGKKTELIDYKKAVYNAKRATEAMQDVLRALDAVYANLEENE